MAIGTGEHRHKKRRVIVAESGFQQSAAGDGGLLAPDEPPAYETINDGGSARALLVCDHASRRIPRRLDNLGLDELALRRHIACDIGAVDVARRLSRLLDAPAILASYSRLVVDCNRHLSDPTSILAVSDGEFVPGNHDLSQEEKDDRAAAIFHPYHGAISQRLKRFTDAGIVPAFIAIHSFTPIFNRTSRPWQIGVLWDTDPRIPVPLMEKLSRIPGVVVGDNEPYSGKAPADYTVDHHAEPTGLPHVSIEVRQDLVSTPEGADRWSAILGGVLGEILADEQLYSILDSASG
jgi:predicted N-formylglutamate amidohydrolase